MKWIVKTLQRLLAILIIAGAGIWGWTALGFNAEVSGAVQFDPSSIGADLDAYLVDSEAKVPNLRDDAQKRILWAGAPGQQTNWSVVYLHGFSASPMELTPVPEKVAEALGANLFLTRLKGHGRDSAAMAEPRGDDWLVDAAEAMEIGRRIGKKVIVISTSTGGTVAAALAADPEISKGLAGTVFVSPNFRVNNSVAGLLTLPAARWWAPLATGETRSWVPQNEMQAKYWTYSYPTEAVVTMAHLVDYVRRLDYAAIPSPAMFAFSDRDTIVDPARTREVAQAWGGRVTLTVVTPSEGDDPNAHLIAGDILSPSKTQMMIDEILEWTKGL